jgi:hypothetical protein
MRTCSGREQKGYIDLITPDLSCEIRKRRDSGNHFYFIPGGMDRMKREKEKKEKKDACFHDKR